jgi:hypothetical protein
MNIASKDETRRKRVLQHNGWQEMMYERVDPNANTFRVTHDRPRISTKLL